MLLDHLDRHPLLYGFPLETKILPYFLSKQAHGLDLCSDANFLGLFREMGRAYPFLAANRGNPIEPPENWHALPRTVAAIFDYIMNEFAKRKGKMRWCEKSPMHVQHIAELSTAFSNAQFIHVIRDGRDCAASFHRRWGYSPDSTIYRWRRAIVEGRSQGLRLPADRYLEVFYERLTADPVKQLERICRFLQIAFDPGMLHAARDTLRVKGMAETAIVENSGRFKDYFTTEKLAYLEAIAGATLASLGYETTQPDGSRVPSPPLLAYWRLRDRARFTARLITNKLRAPRPFPWRLLTSRVLRSMRQYFNERF